MNFFYYIKEHKILFLFISIIINILLTIAMIFIVLNNNTNCSDNNSIKNVEEIKNNVDEEGINNYYVEVKGAVKNPGVYELDGNSIINDLIIKSGGFTKSAYTKNINLSRKVSNELVVYVYTQNEYKNIHKDNIVYVTKEVYIDSPCECSTYDINNCLDNGKSEVIASDKDTIYNNNENNSSINQESLKININTASKEELQTLSGIGSSKAEDIIKYREKSGLFKDISEITKVSGIGQTLYEKIKDSITI